MDECDVQRHVANVLLFFVDTAQPFVRMKAAVGNGEADASVSPAGFDRPPLYSENWGRWWVCTSHLMVRRFNSICVYSSARDAELVG